MCCRITVVYCRIDQQNVFSTEFIDLMNTKSVRTFSFGSMLTMLEDLNGNSEYDIRLNLADKRRGIYSIQITDGTDEYHTDNAYSVEVKAMYSTASLDEVNGE